MQGDIDNFAQCGDFFRSVLGKEERERLTDNIAGSLVCAQEFIQTRAISNFASADATYGRMIATKVEKLKKERSRASKPIVSKPAPLNPPRSCPYKSNL
jgi:catalase